MREFGHQAVVWQTAVHPVVALELLADGEWKGVGVLGPEAMPRRPVPRPTRRPRRAVGHRGARHIGRLTKHAVEQLLEAYDLDPVGALTTALRVVLDRPGATWPELVAVLDVDDTRRAALLLGEERALDALAAELNERRTLA